MRMEKWIPDTGKWRLPVALVEGSGIWWWQKPGQKQRSKSSEG